MGDLQLVRVGSRRGIGTVKPELYHPAPEDSHPLAEAELFRLGEEDLKAEAYAEVGLALPYLPDYPVEEVQPVEILHTVLEGADTGQNNGLRVGKDLGIGGYPGIGPYLQKALLNAPYIPHPVVDNRDHRITLVPKKSLPGIV